MLDVISVGNATLDVFVHVANRHLKSGKLCLEQGSKIEVDNISFATGGGATNTAVAFSRLGLKTGIVCALGKDESAKKILKELKKEKVDCAGIAEIPKFKTAYSAILTGFGGDRVILTYGGATGHLEKESLIKWKFLEKAQWVYAGSFHSEPRLLKKIFGFACEKGILVAWNPGKSELKQGIKKLRPLLEKTTVLFLNEEEAEMLARKKSAKGNLKKLQETVPLVIITLGAKGSIAFDGFKYYKQRAKRTKVLDTTGAGDAFNAGFLAGIIKERGIAESLKLGSENSASVIKYGGAKNRLLRKKI